MDMRKLALTALSLIVLLGIFRLGTMTSVSRSMEDCPMGSVCPAQFESAQLMGSVSTPFALGLLIAFIAVFTLTLAAPLRRAYAAPLAVFTDSGPPALRSVFKKE